MSCETVRTSVGPIDGADALDGLFTFVRAGARHVAVSRLIDDPDAGWVWSTLVHAERRPLTSTRKVTAKMDKNRHLKFISRGDRGWGPRRCDSLFSGRCFWQYNFPELRPREGPFLHPK